MTQRRKSPKVGLPDDPAMLVRAAKLLRRTWDVIGADHLKAAEDCGESRPGEAEMTGDEVADAVSACGFVGGYPSTYGGDLECCEWLEGLSFEQQRLVLDHVFPRDSRHGW